MHFPSALPLLLLVACANCDKAPVESGTPDTNLDSDETDTGRETSGTGAETGPETGDTATPDTAPETADTGTPDTAPPDDPVDPPPELTCDPAYPEQCTLSMARATTRLQVDLFMGVDWVGDTNGDGYDEAMATNEGNHAVFYGPVPRGVVSWPEADLVYGGTAGALSGMGDMNGDGYDDVARYYYKEIQYFLGPTYSLEEGEQSGIIDCDGASCGFSSDSPYEGADDVNGDGYQDIIIGAQYDRTNGCRDDDSSRCSGAVYVQPGPVTSDVNLMDSSHKILGQLGYRAGQAVSSAGDVNGDGLSDIMIGVPGAVFVVEGPTTDSNEIDANDPATSLALIEVWITDDPGYPQWSIAPVGDFFGDGTDDILLANYDSDTMAVVFSNPTGALGVEDADLALYWEAESVQYDAVGAPGDVNRDGNPDLLVGCHSCRVAGSVEYWQGMTWLVYGPREGTVDLREADVAFVGEAAYNESGICVSGAGDTDGDGFSDFLIAGAYSGAAYLISGTALP